MARTEKDTVSYFPHDAGASKGDTLTIVQSRFGNDGYAVWFKLLEKLAETDGHYVDCRIDLKWKLLLVYFGVNEQTTVDILNLLVEMECLDRELWESGVIWCQKLVDNVGDVYANRKREKPIKPIIPPHNAITTDDNPISTVANTQRKGKETKGNKRKGNKKTTALTEQVQIGKWSIDKSWGDTFYAELLADGWVHEQIEEEIKRCSDYWDDLASRGKVLKSPKLALRNWFDKAGAIRREATRRSSGQRDYVGQKYDHIVKR